MSEDASPPKLAQKYSATLTFSNGELTVKLQGHGDQVGVATLTVGDTDLDHADGTGRSVRTLTVGADDLIAVRRFLNRYLSTLEPPPPPAPVTDQAGYQPG